MQLVKSLDLVQKSSYPNAIIIVPFGVLITNECILRENYPKLEVCMELIISTEALETAEISLSYAISLEDA